MMEEFRETRPTPDPTSLTTAQLYRESDNIKQIFEAKIEITRFEKRLLEAELCMSELKRELEYASKKAASQTTLIIVSFIVISVIMTAVAILAMYAMVQ